MAPPSRTPAKAAPKFVHCVGNPAFNPEDYIQDAARQQRALDYLKKDDLYYASLVTFGLPERDTYTYHAMTAVKLGQVQHIITLGGANDLHAWYRAAPEDDSASRSTPPGTLPPLPPPPPADTDAYVAVFAPHTQTSSALTSLVANAKKTSLRAAVGAHLAARRHIHAGLPAAFTVPRCRRGAPSANPYFDFWAWSCRALEWAGPCAASARRPASHHVLPVFMHHFGCAVPSHEGLELLRLAAAGRPIADVGSGNGYWTFMLRRYGVTVHPVDNMQSEWRVNWVADTEIADGPAWLRRRNGGADLVLLLVYPVVGGGVAGGVEGGFTRDLVAAYEGDTIAVVGTQNANGYTGFRDMTMDQYMEREHSDWTKIVQVPLPSFAGKDEALYIFQRGERAPKAAAEADVHTT
ncbi:hypothetical protein VD0002_g9347 [Verticillium dahliae]|uniref:Uncharacterized protein n=1 Tax=Verticillium dahliae TaxID=27337 RepID=A0A2J8C7U6_VERDA|nr:hypothetical protein EV126DRAFT_520371 [Verticillium dahliae]PNH33101.1 hypothetical protein BJF96_g3746 [Verticillium dahliae]PNH37389.1 hypothetical protein VD0004_g9400 [Verticillium dahliae]PNH43620.1 hypothetical protein VD0003_g9593 [Verticillium dahliae]PNH58178.1 hypothetical protein VD0002_g9347 [Verticillium dahliae]